MSAVYPLTSSCRRVASCSSSQTRACGGVTDDRRPLAYGVVGFLHTGDGAHGMAISRSTTKLYVSNRVAGTISVISFAHHRVVATWHVGGSPDMLQVSPDGTQLWASNRYNGTVSVINTHTGHLIHTIRVGTSPHGLTILPPTWGTQPRPQRRLPLTLGERNARSRRSRPGRFRRQ